MRGLLAALAATALTATAAHGDALEFTTTLSTQAPDAKMEAIDKNSWGDSYLRAVVDKQTHAATVDVVKALRFRGPRRDYHSAHYGRDGGLVRVPLQTAHRGTIDCNGKAYAADCILHQEVSFPIDEPTVRAIAAGQGDWAFRIKDRDGNDLTGSIGAAEAAGLVRRLDDHRAKHAARTLQSRSATAAVQ